MDGGGAVGTCTVFAPGDRLDVGQWTDFAVLSGRKGGTGFRARVMHPGWVCALIMPASEQLHGGVLPAQQIPHSMPQDINSEAVEALHVVSYNLKGIEDFAQRMQAESAAAQWSHLFSLDSRLQGRST